MLNRWRVNVKSSETAKKQENTQKGEKTERKDEHAKTCKFVKMSNKKRKRDNR